jgi:hypothetical protein
VNTGLIKSGIPQAGGQLPDGSAADRGRESIFFLPTAPQAALPYVHKRLTFSQRHTTPGLHLFPPTFFQQSKENDVD